METLLGAWFAVTLLGAGLARSARADARVASRIHSMEARAGDASSIRRSALAERVIASRWFDRSTVERRLQLAGEPGAEQRLALRKLGWGATGCGIGVALAIAVSPVAVAMIPILLAAGFRAPDVLLARRAADRQRAIARSVPDLLDLLAASVAAGRSWTTALPDAAARLSGPLGEEVARATDTVGAGARWQDAMASLVVTTDVASLRRLEAIVARSERLGASLAGALRAQAREVRAARRSEALERARTAPVRLLFPLVFLVLPAFLMLTVGPVVLSTIRGLR